MENLGDNMLIEILARLPIREAHQFKTISKHWLSLISSPYFKHRYHIHHDHKNNLSLLFNTVVRNTKHSEELSFEERVFTRTNSLRAYEDDNTKLPQLSAGVLFVSSDLILIDAGSDEDVLMIFNGLTKQSVALPLPPTPYKDTTHKRAIKYGCLRNSKDPTQYKVVLAKRGHHDHVLDMFVFCSSSGDWSKFSITVPSKFDFVITYWGQRGQHVTICNGMLFWTHSMIVGYDPFNNPNQCEFIEFPDELCSSNYICITNVQGYIRLYSANMTSTSTLSVWDLTDYENRIWSKKYFVDLDRVDWTTISSNPTPTKISIKGFNPFDGDVVYLLLFHHFVAVNLTKKTVQSIANFESECKCVFLSRIFIYVSPSWPMPLKAHKKTQQRKNPQLQF